jgi:dTDP-glucose 4,6-dehydratase
MNDSRKTFLITGGAGFIGSHLAEFFLDEGHRVVVMDNLLTGSASNVARFANRDYLFIDHDVTNYMVIDEPVDFVLHFASPASPIDYLKFPIQTLKVGALGTHKALGLARAKNARFILASTSEVYGDPQVNPQPETYWGHVNPIGPRGVYDEAKRFAEAMTMAYHRTHGLDTRIARIFNTYGPRMRIDDGRAVPNFMLQALTGQALTVYGDGQQTRSFCYVDDTVRGLVGLLRSDEHQPVNVGNPNEITIREIAERVIAVTGSKSELIFEDLPVDDPKVRRPDTERAQKTFDWQPQVDLAEGLELTLPWFESQVAKLPQGN